MKTISLAATALSALATLTLGAPQNSDVVGPGGPIQPCTTSTCTFPRLTFGPTSTAYEATITETSTLNCHGCGVVDVGDCVHVPVPVSFTTTVTAWEPYTTTAYTCKATPSPQ